MNPVSGFNVSQPPLPPQQKSKNRAIIVVAIVLAGLIVIGIVAGIGIALSNMAGATVGTGGIDVVYIEGTISADTSSNSMWSTQVYNQTYTMNTIKSLIEDPTSEAILLYVNTPGGSVYETDEVYLKLLEYKETGRPVYAYFAQTAASGGYYIACAADKVYCNRNTLTGSIGVIYGTYLDVSEFLSNYGVRTNTFTSGANKSMGSSYEPMTEQQKAIFQSLVQEAYEQFVDVVATGRKMQKSAIYPLADGRVYTAKQALEAGLVDEIATYETALASIKEALGDPQMAVNDHKRSVSVSFSSLFSMLSKIRGQSEAEVILDAVTAYNKTGYYCAELAQ